MHFALLHFCLITSNACYATYEHEMVVVGCVCVC